MEDFVLAFLRLMDLTHLAYLLLGTMLGLLVGVLPGLSGTAGLTILLPFVFGMEKSHALAMMIGLLSPTTTSDTFPSVLMGIPGTAASQATVVDGFPMAKRGEAARALGAAFTASMFGGVFGAFVLTFAVFYAEPIILGVGFGEQMMLILLALTMVGMLTGTNALKGLASCGVGLLVGCIGAAIGTAEDRMTFGIDYLSEGFPIVIVGLAMFAMPEIIELLRRHYTISTGGVLGHGWIEGIRDVFRHKFLVFRCSVIGCLVGALPGLGGSVVDWIAYGHAVQTSKHPERFGTGDVRGVLAPESANNAKEGGALIPTLLFGIPGSGSMAILLGGFVLVGVQPGIEMVTSDLDLVYVMIWSVALANIVGTATCLLLAGPIARLTTIRYVFLGPFMLVLIFFAAFQASRDWADLVALFALGTLGTYMKRFGWSRPALLIGFFLAPRLEQNTYLAFGAYGLAFLERPATLFLLALTVISGIVAIRFKPNKPNDKLMRTVHTPVHRYGQAGFTLFLLLFTVVAFVDSLQKKTLALAFPVSIAIPTFILLAAIFVMQLRRTEPHSVFHDLDYDPKETVTSNLHYLLWIAGILVLTALLGFPLAIAAWMFIFLLVKAPDSLRRNAVLALCAIAALGVMAYSLTLKYPEGLLQRFIPLPWWLGG